MADPAPIRARAAVVLLMSAALVGAAFGAGRAVGRWTPDERTTREHQERLAQFAPVRAHLPVGEVVGFLSDAPPDYRGGPGVPNFMLAQSAVAPVVLDDTPAHRLVLATFLFRDTDPATYTTEELRIVMEFGNGIVLFERTAP